MARKESASKPWLARRRGHLFSFPVFSRWTDSRCARLAFRAATESQARRNRSNSLGEDRAFDPERRSLTTLQDVPRIEDYDQRL